MIKFEDKKKRKVIITSKIVTEQENRKKDGAASGQVRSEEFVSGTLCLGYPFEVKVGFQKYY